MARKWLLACVAGAALAAGAAGTAARTAAAARDLPTSPGTAHRTVRP